MPSRFRQAVPSWLDGVAVGASALCLIHCLALPLLIAALPALGSLAGAEWVHWSLLLFAVPTSMWALTGGGGGRLALLIGSIGLALMAIGVAAFAGSEIERTLTLAGVILVGAAHLRRWFVVQRRHGYA